MQWLEGVEWQSQREAFRTSLAITNLAPEALVVLQFICFRASIGGSKLDLFHFNLFSETPSNLAFDLKA